MQDSERLQRFKGNGDNLKKEDEEFSSRIFDLLNHPKITKHCMVDAYYYDYSVIPRHLQGKFYRDMYLIYGITEDGEIFSKWVERYDLDSDVKIENGELKRN